MGHSAKKIALPLLLTSLVGLSCLTVAEVVNQEEGPGKLETATGEPLAAPAGPEKTTGLTYYIHPEGGSRNQCTGMVDKPYPGQGSDQPCAWDHPFRALPPGGSPRISGGDTLIISTGSYMMGYGAPGSEG